MTQEIQHYTVAGTATHIESINLYVDSLATCTIHSHSGGSYEIKLNSQVTKGKSIDEVYNMLVQKAQTFVDQDNASLPPSETVFQLRYRGENYPTRRLLVNLNGEPKQKLIVVITEELRDIVAYDACSPSVSARIEANNINRRIQNLQETEPIFVATELAILQHKWQDIATTLEAIHKISLIDLPF